jgi:predicted TIM-barrel fold metal-dependent hydrolase
MIIDGHAHACGEYLTADCIIKTLDNSKADKVILVPGEPDSRAGYFLPDLAELFPGLNVVKATNLLTGIVIKITGMLDTVPKGNEYVNQLRSSLNDRVIQFIWVTTRIQDPEEYLDNKLSEWHFSGVKLHQCWDKFSIDSKFFREIAEWTERNKLPLFIHLSSDAEVRKIIGFKKDHPDLNLIIAHLFGLELFITERSGLHNLYFDISSPQLVSRKRIMSAIKSFGPGSLILGSDTPYGKNNLQKIIDKVSGLDLDDHEKELIFGGNLLKILPDLNRTMREQNARHSSC